MLTVNLKHNDLVIRESNSEFLVIAKEQTVEVESLVETANGKNYTVLSIDKEGRVYVG